MSRQTAITDSQNSTMSTSSTVGTCSVSKSCRGSIVLPLIIVFISSKSDTLNNENNNSFLPLLVQCIQSSSYFIPTLFII
ncbi:hypothetical protein T4A_12704 [Trichinella pseudospiralis]|uniref:Uncharacterized protein n=1 Tax=Trichinella pseudospiralis TaxID=6337 RepID=A0A0V1EHX1_TRIPS|nr:hypothetical protein T4A_12704 [Trichinella pseudospiralis]